MPTLLDIILYDQQFILKNKNIKQKNKNENENENKNNFEKNKKNILDSFVNYPRLELIKKYKIQTYQFLLNKNYRNIFIKLLIIPMTFDLCYSLHFIKKYKK
jgi:hypothetical protein